MTTLKQSASGMHIVAAASRQGGTGNYRTSDTVWDISERQGFTSPAAFDGDIVSVRLY